MWDRAELKQNAKASFRRNYGPCVIVALVLALLTAAPFGYTSSKMSEPQTMEQLQRLQNLSQDELIALAAAIGSASILVSCLALLLNIFVTNPLKVGGFRFFVKNSRDGGNAPAGLLFSSYKDGRFGHTFCTMLLKDIFLFLWSLLFVIPGIVKFYSYRMVPYLLADHPEMSASETITRSREMMKGQKWNAFVLDLSFILWHCLSLITFGLAGIFYVAPYVQATNAELYQALNK